MIALNMKPKQITYGTLKSKGGIVEQIKSELEREVLWIIVYLCL